VGGVAVRNGILPAGNLDSGGLEDRLRRHRLDLFAHSRQHPHLASGTLVYLFSRFWLWMTFALLLPSTSYGVCLNPGQ